MIQDKRLLIEHRLQEQLNPSYLEVIDESAQHVGHAGYQGGGRHFAVKISAESLKHPSRVEAHRMIYQILGDLMSHEIHALRIELK